MHTSTKIVLTIMVLLASASGIAKIMLMPQEVAFFGAFGVNNNWLMGFGLLQVMGAVLLLLPKTRTFALVLVGLSFVVSALALLAAGDIVMAVVTLLFVGLLVFLWTRFRLTR